MVMRQMRASAKWIMLIVIFSFVGWMIFDVGMNVTGQSGGASDTALRINGVKVDYQSFLFSVRNAQERQRNRTGTGPVTLEDQRALEDQVVEEIIQSIILSQEYQRRGITVTDAEIRAAAQSSPPPEIMNSSEFQSDGVFDFQKYQRYLAAGTDPQFLASLENLYRAEIPRVKLYEQLSGGVYVPDSHLWRMYQDEHDSVKVAVLAILTRTAFNDGQIEINDREVGEYYEEHSEDFQRPQTAYTSYIATSRKVNASDTTATEALATLIHDEVTTEGVDFSAVARRESADSSSRSNGGDLGEVEFGRFVTEFEEAVRRLNPGEISQPVATQFGIHIIKLESKDDDSFRSSHILLAYELRDDHLSEVEDRADSLDLFGAEQTEPSALDAVAVKLDVDVQLSRPLFEGDRMRIDGELVPDISIWAFEARPGETSLVYETPNRFFLFRLDSLAEAHTIPLDDIRETVRGQLLVVRKAERAMTLAIEIRERLVSGTPISAIVEEVIGVTVDTLGPLTRIEPGIELRPMPQAIGAAFGLGIEEYSQPIAADNQNVYIIQTIDRFTSDSAAFLLQLAPQRQSVTPIARDARIRMFLASLRESATIIDRRRRIEEIQRELAESSSLFPGSF